MVLSLVTPIPTPVYAETTLSGTRAYSDSGEGFDYAIGGLPFNSAATRDRPIMRQSAPVRKDQTDTSREPGEHSLAFWWLKAQSSFHGGAGQRYLGSADTDNDSISRYRFWDSAGLDVFTEPGSVTLLPTTTKLVDTAGVTPLIATTDAGYLYVASGVTLSRLSMAPVGGQPDLPSSTMNFTTTSVAWGGADPILSLAAEGEHYYLATATGVYVGTGTAAAVRIHSLPASSDPLIAYVKQRLILGVRTHGAVSSVYELDPTLSSLTALPTAIFETVKSWRWTAIVDTPTAILIAGADGSHSSVFRMNLDTSGSVPVLAPGVVSVQMPPAELITGMASYLGTVVGVQTTKGFRVGALNDSGDFTYGPLLFEHSWKTPNGAVFGHENSLYAGFTDDVGAAGLARVDLTSTIGSGQSLRFPYAPDMQAVGGPAGAVTAGTTWDYERKVFVVAGVGVFVQSEAKVASGWLTTSRIRWDTLEPKLLRYARIRGDGDAGTISLEVGRDSDTALSLVGSLDLTQRNDSGDLYVPAGPGQYFTSRITLTGGTFSGYQLKAIPAQRKQRIIVLPLACYDREVGGSGQIGTGQGSAMSRLLALETLEQTGEVVTLQWLSVFPDQELTEYAIIEGIEFDQTARSSDAYGWGGVVNLTLRTVD